MPPSPSGVLVDYLDRVPINRAQRSGFRFPLQTVLRPRQNYRAFAGQIVSGEAKPGDEVVVLPPGRRSAVKAASVAIRLTDEVDVRRGDVLANLRPPSPAPSTRRGCGLTTARLN